MKVTRKRKMSAKEIAELERMAHDTSDIRPLSPAMREAWNAARKTGEKMRRGRPRKDPKTKSRIVPISMEPSLLTQIDRFAKTVGLTRSRLVAEGLRLRMKVSGS